MTCTTLALKSLGHELELSSETFGWLNRSDDLENDAPALQHRLQEDGYLYMPGLLDPEVVLEGRRSLTRQLADAGSLHPDYPHEEGIVNPRKASGFSPELARNNTAIHHVVFGEALLSFYRKLFNFDILHFDFIWVRSIGTGNGTPPHCDLVYMGRGTKNLLTCWIPYGEIPLEMGGLILLEDSHRKASQIKHYLESDVDSYCENRPDQVQKVKVENKWSHRGWLSNNPVSLRQKLGGRWLTAETFRPGDVLTFPMHLVHGSLDNQTDRVRLSTDTRYQRADEPADERWIGVNPPGHGPAGKRGRIC